MRGVQAGSAIAPPARTGHAGGNAGVGTGPMPAEAAR